jgi:hypothetical protein
MENLLHAQAVAQMKLRSEPDFAIDNSVGGEVFDNFATDANEMIALLHDFQRQVDADEIVGQVDAAFGRDQRRFQGIWERETDLATELGNRRDAQGRIEVAMKFDLWERFVVDRHFRLRIGNVNYGTGAVGRKSRSLAAQEDSFWWLSADDRPCLRIKAALKRRPYSDKTKGARRAVPLR